MWNLADAFGILFLGYGILDGYRKGFVKKGISLGASLLTLAAVYLVSPYVAQFIEGILPNAFSLESLAGSESDIYRMLYLSGFGEAAEEYVYSFGSRVLALVITYIVVRLLLKMVALSLELMVKVPGLSILNRLMGSAFGFLQQLLVLWMLFLVLAIFSHTGFGERLYELIRQSMWMGYLYEHNVLLLLGIIFILGI